MGNDWISLVQFPLDYRIFCACFSWSAYRSSLLFRSILCPNQRSLQMPQFQLQAIPLLFHYPPPVQRSKEPRSYKTSHLLLRLEYLLPHPQHSSYYRQRKTLAVRSPASSSAPNYLLGTVFGVVKHVHVLKTQYDVMQLNAYLLTRASKY